MKKIILFFVLMAGLGSVCHAQANAGPTTYGFDKNSPTNSTMNSTTNSNQ